MYIYIRIYPTHDVACPEKGDQQDQQPIHAVLPVLRQTQMGSTTGTSIGRCLIQTYIIIILYTYTYMIYTYIYYTYIYMNYIH